MKVTIELSDLQVLKVLALYPTTEEQTKAVLAAVHETPELDLTDRCRTNKTYAELSLAVCAYALAVISEKYKTGTPYEPPCQSV